MSLRLRLLNTYLRNVEKRAFAAITDPLVARARFERQARMFRRPKGAKFVPDQVGGVDGAWVSRGEYGPRIILYFHGGAHIMGSARTHRSMLARLAGQCDAQAFLPDYRLAPEHHFADALDDAWQVWTGLQRLGHRPDDIILGGDSAGGGLMLSLLSKICGTGGPYPAGAFAISPWSDFTLSGTSLKTNAESEALLPVQGIELARDLTIGTGDATNLSPLFAEYPDCPPVMLQASEVEILRDDTLRMAEKLKGQGCKVTLDMAPDTPHVVGMFQGWVPEADASLDRIAHFIGPARPAVRPPEN